MTMQVREERSVRPAEAQSTCRTRSESSVRGRGREAWRLCSKTVGNIHRWEWRIFSMKVVRVVHCRAVWCIELADVTV